MSVQNFDELATHYAHNVVVARYTDSEGEVTAVAIECEDCSEVLIDYEREGEQ
jgi:hypothetical protein